MYNQKSQVLKKICLITPGHISTNPRLVKEAMSLTKGQYQVHIIFTQYVASQVRFDHQILRNHPQWSYDILNWVGEDTLSKINRLLSKLTSCLIPIPQVKQNRNFFWQSNKAKAYKADLYIAHNLGALPVAVYAAKKNQARCGFDAEDYHRGETNAGERESEVLIKIDVEDQFLQHVNYFSTSSPQISKKYRDRYSFLNPKVILNVFPKSYLSITDAIIKKKTKLIWFSQSIGTNRGLEDIFKALEVLNNNDIELHLLGDTSFTSKEILDFIKGAPDKIFLHSPLAPDEIVEFCSQFDIGLALEPAFSINNDCALSNKLFTYMQAGLICIATDTTAQKKFLQDYPDVGNLYTIGDYESLAKQILFYHNNKPLLVEKRKAALGLAQSTLNWENESRKFLEVIRSTLSN